MNKVGDWSADQTAEWLVQVGFGHLTAQFISSGIDGPKLLELQELRLASILRCNPKERKKVWELISQLQSSNKNMFGKGPPRTNQRPPNAGRGPPPLPQSNYPQQGGYPTGGYPTGGFPPHQQYDYEDDDDWSDDSDIEPPPPVQTRPQNFPQFNHNRPPANRPPVNRPLQQPPNPGQWPPQTQPTHNRGKPAPKLPHRDDRPFNPDHPPIPMRDEVVDGSEYMEFDQSEPPPTWGAPPVTPTRRESSQQRPPLNLPPRNAPQPPQVEEQYEPVLDPRPPLYPTSQRPADNGPPRNSPHGSQNRGHNSYLSGYNSQSSHNNRSPRSSSNSRTSLERRPVTPTSPPFHSPPNSSRSSRSGSGKSVDSHAPYRDGSKDSLNSVDSEPRPFKDNFVPPQSQIKDAMSRSFQKLTISSNNKQLPPTKMAVERKPEISSVISQLMSNKNKPPKAADPTPAPRRSEPQMPPKRHQPTAPVGVEDQPWFKNVTRQAAAAAVRATSQDGAFLVRPGQNSDHPYSLTLFYRKIYNLQIRKRSDGMFALGNEKENEPTFESAEKMIECYMRDRLVLAEDAGSVVLTGPP